MYSSLSFHVLGGIGSHLQSLLRRWNSNQDFGSTKWSRVRLLTWYNVLTGKTDFPTRNATDVGAVSGEAAIVAPFLSSKLS